MASVTDTHFDAAQIAFVARQAGFSGDALGIAVAIALAESGGNTRAHNTRGPDDSYGLWQINMKGSLGPARRSQFGLNSDADLFNPATNARAAFAISSSGTNFKPWTTYTSGAYRVHLSKANNAAGGPLNGPQTVSGAGAASAALGTIRDIFGFGEITEQIFIAALTIVFVVAGLGIIGLGLARLTGIKPTDAAKTGLSVVSGGTTAATLAAAAV